MEDELTFEEKISTAVPIWALLGLTEEEYAKKYGQPFEFDSKKNDIEIIDLDNIKSIDKK
jgi:hypothetical protein